MSLIKKIFHIIKTCTQFIVRYTDEISLIVIGLFLYIAAVSTQTGWLYYIVSLLISLITMGYIFPRWNVKDLEVLREFSGHCFEGDEISITLKVRNNAKKEKTLVYIEENLDPEYFHMRERRVFLLPKVGKNEIKTISYSVRCLRRGVILLPDCHVMTSFPFGFFPTRKKLHTHDIITVYPAAPVVNMISETRTAIQVFGQSQSIPLSGRSFDFSGIREYQPSDGIRFIHWPVTARMNKLMVKEFNELSRQRVYVVMDMGEDSQAGKGKECTIEYEVKVAAGILRYCIKGKKFLTILSAKEKNIIEACNNKRFEALDFLASIENKAKLSTSEILKKYIGEISQGARLFLLQSDPAIEPQVIIDLVMKRISVTIIFFLGFTFHEDQVARFDEERYKDTCIQLKKVGDIQIVQIKKGDDLSKKLIEARFLKI